MTISIQEKQDERIRFARLAEGAVGGRRVEFNYLSITDRK
jgi:hypothetical protein